MRENPFKKAMEEAQFERDVRDRMLDKLSYTYEQFIEEEKRCLKPYRQIGENPDEQDTSWSGELLWLDDEHTVPKPKPIYGHVEVTEDELGDFDKANLTAVRRVLELLDTLIDSAV